MGLYDSAGTHYQLCVQFRRQVWVAAVLIFAGGCSKPESRVSIGNREQILHVGNRAEPDSIDPALWTSTYEWHITAALFEPLVDFDADKGEAIPRAAESWDVSDDGLVYTFHLRPAARWSNGDPVTAADFVYAFHRVLHPKLGAQNADRLFVLKNGREFYEGTITDPAQIGCRALDDHTLQLTLRAPIAYFLSNLFSPYWYPVHRATIEKFGAIDARGTDWTRPGNLVGNGPFVLQEWKLNDVIRLERNPHYWNQAAVKLRGISLYPMDSSGAEERAFRSGQLHLTYEVPSEKIETYQREAPDELRLEPALNIYYLPLNTKRPPLNDVRVRRALSLALNRRQLAEKVAGPGFRPAYHFSVPGIAGYTSRAKLREDVTEARRLLAEAGFPDGRGFPVLKYTFNTHDLHRRVAEAVQQMWKDNLGIEVELLNSEFKVHLAALYSHDFDIARIGYGAEYADAASYLLQLTTTAKDNFSGWSNSRYDSLMAQAVVERDKTKRYALYQQAEALFVEDVPVLPLFFDARRYLIQRSVKNWQPGLLENYNYLTAWLAAE
jgi:oligopeptide transport system substrate-binding protein